MFMVERSEGVLGIANSNLMVLVQPNTEYYMDDTTLYLTKQMYKPCNRVM